MFKIILKTTVFFSLFLSTRKKILVPFPNAKNPTRTKNRSSNVWMNSVRMHKSVRKIPILLHCHQIWSQCRRNRYSTIWPWISSKCPRWTIKLRRARVRGRRVVFPGWWKGCGGGERNRWCLKILYFILKQFNGNICTMKYIDFWVKCFLKVTFVRIK